MFGMFEGYGSELAAMLWLVFIPAAFAVAKWYANYIKDKALGKEHDLEQDNTIHELEAEVEKLKESTDRFDKFIVAYDAYKRGQKSKGDDTGTFRRPSRNDDKP